MNGETAVEAYKDLLREGFSKYIGRAFQMLPRLDRPHILDIGCGSGVPTMELARLSNGKLMGLDINQSLLDRLAMKIKEAGLSSQVKIMKCSMFNMPFLDESLDIIWAEGSIFVIGFERGLTEWRKLLKSNGFLVVHDEAGNIKEKMGHISSHGYDLLGHFILGRGVWWNEYYAPLEKRVHEIRKSHGYDPDVIAVLDAEQQEIEMFRRNPGRYRSVYFVMQKRQ